jgi:hypothetical protein
MSPYPAYADQGKRLAESRIGRKRLLVDDGVITIVGKAIRGKPVSQSI